MHLLVILLQQILGLLAREQPVPQPEPVVRRAVDPRSGEGRGEGRLGSEGRSPDAFARWNEPDRSSLPLTPKHRVASIGSRSCSPPGSTLRNHDWGYQTAKTMAAPLGSCATGAGYGSTVFASWGAMAVVSDWVDMAGSLVTSFYGRVAALFLSRSH
jgi:hypothetical protein